MGKQEKAVSQTPEPVGAAFAFEGEMSIASKEAENANPPPVPPTLDKLLEVGQYNGEIQAKLDLLRKLAHTFLLEVGSITMLELLDPKGGIDFYDEVRKFETSLIERALLQTAGHQARAAQLLGIPATTLSTKMKQYEINKSTRI